MAALDAEVLDVGGTGLADTQPVQAEQHSKRGVVTVVLLLPVLVAYQFAIQYAAYP